MKRLSILLLLSLILLAAAADAFIVGFNGTGN